MVSVRVNPIWNLESKTKIYVRAWSFTVLQHFYTQKCGLRGLLYRNPWTFSKFSFLVKTIRCVVHLKNRKQKIFETEVIDEAVRLG